MINNPTLMVEAAISNLKRADNYTLKTVRGKRIAFYAEFKEYVTLIKNEKNSHFKWNFV